MVELDTADLSVLLKRLRAAGRESEVDASYAEAGTLAAAAGLLVLPATPDGGAAVEVDKDQMALKDFIAVAGSVRAELLYLAAERFGKGDLLTAKALLDEQYNGSAPVGDALADLDAATRHLNGAILTLTVGFPHAGICHLWRMSVDWQADLFAAIELLQESLDEDDEVGDYSDGAFDELARELAELPSVRRIRRPRARDIEHPKLTELLASPSGAWQADSVVRDAVQLFAPERDRVEQDSHNRLDDLAAELAADTNFGKNTTADARRFAAAR